MRILITIIIILTSIQTFAQFDYDLYYDLTSKESLKKNEKVNTITEYLSESKGDKTKTLVQKFLKNGYPSTIIQFNKQGLIAIKKEFIYDSKDHIKSIETYKKEKHESSTEFELNQQGQIVNYNEYVYSSYNGEKTFVFNTVLEYNPNNTIKKTTKEQGSKKEIYEVNFYNKDGIKTKTLFNIESYRTTKVEYEYNIDSSEMLEKQYENDTTIYATIVHKYEGKKEIEKIDPITSKKPIYWKYDNFGRVTETNEAFYYVVYYKYNSEGYLTNKTLDVLFSDSNEKNLPKKIEYEYEYLLN